MHGRFEKSAKNDESTSQDSGIRFLILPIIIFAAFALVGVLATIQPPTSNWIAEAVQAEFPFYPTVPSDAAPTQLAQPAGSGDATGNVQTAHRSQR